VFKRRLYRGKFLKFFESATFRYSAVIHAYCPMYHHEHLLMEAPGGNLPEIHALYQRRRYHLF
jgi:putative transposase